MPRLFSLDHIAAGLEQSLRAWQRTDPEAGDWREGAPRHQSIDACLDWSFQLLPSYEQQLYPCLGVFPADFYVDAAQDIADVAEERLIRWHRAHLLLRDRATGRAILPPVLREFAASRLTAEKQTVTLRRFAVYYGKLAEANENLNHGQSAIFNTELHNLHEAAAYLCNNVLQIAYADKLLFWLGVRLREVPLGIRAQNLQQVIRCYKAILRVCTEANSPVDWAAVQVNLGIAFSDLSNGDRTQNLQQSMQCYRAALRVYTKADYPHDWAITQNNLGSVYVQLPVGDHVQNVQRAITCHERALQVCTKAEFPHEWAAGTRCLWAEPTRTCLTVIKHRICNALSPVTKRHCSSIPKPTFHSHGLSLGINLGNVYIHMPGGDQRQKKIYALSLALKPPCVFVPKPTFLMSGHRRNTTWVRHIPNCPMVTKHRIENVLSPALKPHCVFVPKPTTRLIGLKRRVT